MSAPAIGAKWVDDVAERSRERRDLHRVAVARVAAAQAAPAAAGKP